MNKEAMNTALFAMDAALFARDVLKGRFELGEPTIAKDAKTSYYYARDVIKGRFILGEEAIAKDEYYQRKYNEFLTN